MPKQADIIKPGRRQFILLALVVLAFYVLLPQFGDFRSSWHLLGHPAPSWTLLAICLAFATYGSAAAIYRFLAFTPLRFGRTLLAQFAATFINRLLPAGIGAVGANYVYLRHERHTAPQAATVVAVNNLVGFIGHSLLLVVTLSLFSSQTTIRFERYSFNPLLVFAVVLGLLVVLWFVGTLLAPARVNNALQAVKLQFLSYRQRPASLLLALASSISLTLFNVLCLFCCSHALGLNVSFIAALLVLTVGVGAGAATPTPGGLGGFEAGLAATLVAYSIEPAPALAVALLYRLVSYWLPLLVGACMFIISQRRGLFGSTSQSG